MTNKDYNISKSDVANYLSLEEQTRYVDHKRIEIMLIKIIQAVADLDDKAAIQLFLIDMLDTNSHELDELEHTIVANKEYERQTLLADEYDNLVEQMLEG